MFKYKGIAHYRNYVKEYQYNTVTQVSEYGFVTTRDIQIKLTDDTEIFIPKGTHTDLASVPRPLWAFVPPFGKYTFAAVIHDYLYEHGLKTKSFADKEFRYIMDASGVAKHRARIMYTSVKIFGRGNFTKE